MLSTLFILSLPIILLNANTETQRKKDLDLPKNTVPILKIEKVEKEISLIIDVDNVNKQGILVQLAFIG